MADALHLMLWPLAACLVLTGILSYFGLHIVSRGVIFVDLALAQVAALGTTVAFAFGYDLHGHEAHAVSLISTFVGAAVFSLTRTRDERIPQARSTSSPSSSATSCS
jgi:zinc/manganese transport system permease protein